MSTVEQWEAELTAFAPAACPWVHARGGYAGLEPWEKILIGNIYIATGAFWNARLGPAEKPYASRPPGWAEALEAQQARDESLQTTEEAQ